MRRARTHEKKISPGLGEGREVKNMRETENELNWGEGRGHRYGGACVCGGGNSTVMWEKLGRKRMGFDY